MVDINEILDVATKVVAAAAAIAALTPTPRDDTILAIIRKVLDILALNIINAKNKEVQTHDDEQEK